MWELEEDDYFNEEDVLLSDDDDDEAKAAYLSPHQLLQQATLNLEHGAFSLCRQYALDSGKEPDPHQRYTHHRAQLIALANILSAAETDILSAAPAAAQTAQSTQEDRSFINWYAVLQVANFSDIPTIDAEYAKLNQLLVPIKDLVPRTKDALAHVQKAYDILSDPKMKAEFDTQLTRFLAGSSSSSTCP